MDKIIEKIKTVAQARQLGDALDGLVADLYENQQERFEEKVNRLLSLSQAEAVLQLVSSSVGGPLSEDEIKQILGSLKAATLKLPIVKLTLAFEPTEAMLEEIGSWFWENTGKHILLDVAVDGSIVGGAIIEYNGVYKDFSVKTRLEKVFRGQREEIEKLLTVFV